MEMGLEMIKKSSQMLAAVCGYIVLTSTSLMPPSVLHEPFLAKTAMHALVCWLVHHFNKASWIFMALGTNTLTADRMANTDFPIRFYLMPLTGKRVKYIL